MENVQKQDLKHVVICNRVHTLNLYLVFKEFTPCNCLILQLFVGILFEIFNHNSLGTVDVNLYNVNITQHDHGHYCVALCYDQITSNSQVTDISNNLTWC